mmetsp:Transcript_30713/g.91225  ORF Transcript_30713/g.91225 Transcript_30713/m.91225 type:complete len:220 (+) Transcript_30713:116-775(+)
MESGGPYRQPRRMGSAEEVTVPRSLLNTSARTRHLLEQKEAQVAEHSQRLAACVQEGERINSHFAALMQQHPQVVAQPTLSMLQAAADAAIVPVLASPLPSPVAGEPLPSPVAGDAARSGLQPFAAGPGAAGHVLPTPHRMPSHAPPAFPAPDALATAAGEASPTLPPAHEALPEPPPPPAHDASATPLATGTEKAEADWVHLGVPVPAWAHLDKLGPA